jgi:hypothetical protein
MGSDNFFSQFASRDPLAQALDLPGAHKYAQQQASDMNGQSAANGGPYSGIAATLAGANAGYRPGGPGSNPTWTPWAPSNNTDFFQRAANLSGAITPQPTFGGGSPVPTGANIPPAWQGK